MTSFTKRHDPRQCPECGGQMKPLVCIEPLSRRRPKLIRQRRFLGSDQILLVGRLYIARARNRRPVLMVNVWCPFCKGAHYHSWPSPPFRQDHVEHRCAHCWMEDAPLREHGYHIGLNPEARVDNDRTAMEFLAAPCRLER